MHGRLRMHFGAVAVWRACLGDAVHSRVALAMAAVVQQERVYTWAETSTSRTVVNSRQAHMELADFRQAASGERGADGTAVVVEPALDLTDGRRFDRWGCLARHPEGRSIVGQGVTS